MQLWAAAEKQRRESWAAQKTRAVKDQTLKARPSPCLFRQSEPAHFMQQISTQDCCELQQHMLPAQSWSGRHAHLLRVVLCRPTFVRFQQAAAQAERMRV